jgi:hypothetical protein
MQIFDIDCIAWGGPSFLHHAEDCFGCGTVALGV